MEAENNTRISVHEAVCAERYKRIEESFERGSKRMARIEYMLYALMVVTFFGKDTFMELLQAVIVK
jgi:predicted nucleic acid-binding Zn ribbon protein